MKEFWKRLARQVESQEMKDTDEKQCVYGPCDGDVTYGAAIERGGKDERYYACKLHQARLRNKLHNGILPFCELILRPKPYTSPHVVPLDVGRAVAEAALKWFDLEQAYEKLMKENEPPGKSPSLIESLGEKAVILIEAKKTS